MRHRLVFTKMGTARKTTAGERLNSLLQVGCSRSGACAHRTRAAGAGMELFTA